MWYKTAKERHGETGERGREGEELVIEYFTSKGFKVADKESDRKSQLSGVDLELYTNAITYLIDVKANLRDDGSFAVEGGKNGWLFKKSKSNLIIHINPRKQKIAMYNKDKMIEYLKPRGFPMSINQLYWVTENAKDADFIRRISVGTSI